MKNLIKIVLLLFTINCFSQNNIEKNKLEGNWILTDYWGNKSDFILSPDNYISMTINGEFINGKDFIIHGGKNDGEKGEVKYSINYKKNPIEIDIIVIKDSEERGRVLGVIKPLNEKECLMTLSFNGKRDIDFTKENAEKIMVLRRIN